MRTTKAVVEAIFTVIVLDAFFAVFFTPKWAGDERAAEQDEYPIVVEGLATASASM